MTRELPPKSEWVSADFDGMLEPDLLCLSHENVVGRIDGCPLELRAGMRLTAYDVGFDNDGNPDGTFASGVVEVSPERTRCRGSKWSLWIDSDGIRRESDVGIARADVVYFDLVVTAVARDTEIWLGHQGHFVDRGSGELRTRIMPGRYNVQFGLGTTTFPINLTRDVQLTEKEIRV